MSAALVDVLPVAHVRELAEAFRRADGATRAFLHSWYGDPERALNHRLLLASQITLDGAVSYTRRALDLRSDPDLATLPSETRLYVSGRLDPWWTEDAVTESAGWMIRNGFTAREVQAFLEGWADRG